MPPPADDAIPDDEIDDLTPPAVEIPLPPPRANPFELVQYDVRVTRQEVKQASQRIGRRLGLVERTLRILVGEDGTNGKVGNLTATLTFWKRVVLAAAGGAIGAVVIAVMAVYGAGEANATQRIKADQTEQRSLTDHSRLEQLEKDLLRLQFPAAFAPHTPGVIP